VRGPPPEVSRAQKVIQQRQQPLQAEQEARLTVKVAENTRRGN
jgi:hypothetical protein